MDSSSRLVAVTGAAGVVGRHLCEHLRRRGWRVRALVRNVDVYPWAEQGIERVRLDLPGAVDASLLDGVDTLIHAAYATRSVDAQEAERVNEAGTARLLDAARARAVRRFVFVSSLSARADAPSYYGRSKHAIESRLDAARDLVVRPGLVLAADGGLAQRMWRAVARLPVVPLFDGGRTEVQTIHVDDLAEGFARAIERDLTGTLCLAEPEGRSMRELLSTFAVAAGTRPRLVAVPAQPALWALRALEALGIRLGASSENLRGLLALRHADTAGDLRRLDLRVRPARESISALAPAFAAALASESKR